MAFMKKTSTVDGIMPLHEILHHTHVKKQVGIVLKLDFKKAFDKVNWDFQFKCLQAMGFSDKICVWIKKILHDGTVYVKINNVMDPYFKISKGVRQGDPLSPFLFNAAIQCRSPVIFLIQKNFLNPSYPHHEEFSYTRRRLSISSLPSYFMSLFFLNNTFLGKMDKHRRHFFWNGKKVKKGYYMVKWCKVCRSKNKGGLGVLDLRKHNISLLCKWWSKLDKHYGLWQGIVKAKYLRNRTIE
jgi:hypothetical protein